MPEPESAKSEEIACLEDVPVAARQAERQLLLAKWYQLIGMLPFSAVVFVVLTWFPDSTSRVWDVFIVASLIWPMCVAAYAFYLTFFFNALDAACDSAWKAHTRLAGCHVNATPNSDFRR